MMTTNPQPDESAVAELDNCSYLVQIFLPLRDAVGQPFLEHQYAKVRQVLVKKFGGMTAWSRSLAEGVWKDAAGRSVHDYLVIFEVMVERIENEWWTEFRAELEQRFKQESVLIRAQHIEVL